MTYIETLETKSERSLRRSAGMWLSTLVAAAVLSVVAAKVGGLTISIAWLHVSVTLGILLCLGLGYIRYARRPADRRLGVAMRSLLTIFAAGSAGGLVSLLGQTFAFPLIDEPLAAADRALGLTAVDITGAVVAIRALPLVLAMAYLTTIPLIILSVVLLSLMGRFDRAWELSAAFSFCMLVATASSLFFPAVGPFEYLNMPPDF
jgi:hypothetical protein